MPTVIYCKKEDREQVHKQIKVESPYVFASLSDSGVDHSATKVVIVGDYPEIKKRYAGLCRIEEVKLAGDPQPDKKKGK